MRKLLYIRVWIEICSAEILLHPSDVCWKNCCIPRISDSFFMGSFLQVPRISLARKIACRCWNRKTSDKLFEAAGTPTPDEKSNRQVQCKGSVTNVNLQKKSIQANFPKKRGAPSLQCRSSNEVQGSRPRRPVLLLQASK